MVWWVLAWDRFCSVADKKSADILDKAESLALYLQDLDRTFKEKRGQGIVFELSTALNELPSDGESDDAQLLRTLYSIAHLMDSLGLLGSAMPDKEETQEQEHRWQQIKQIMWQQQMQQGEQPQLEHQLQSNQAHRPAPSLPRTQLEVSTSAAHEKKILCD